MISFPTRIFFLFNAVTLAGCQSSSHHDHSHPHSTNASIEAQLNEIAFTYHSSAVKHFIQPMFSVLDCEHVGKISSGEVDEHFYALFFYIDRDQSRDITLDEFIRSAHGSTPEKEQYLFGLMDVDKNDLVSVNEFRDFTISAIDSSDTDNDGLVSEREIGLVE